MAGSPPTPTNGTSPTNGTRPSGFVPLVCVVDFHHARGPEVEKWFGVPEGSDPAAEYDWTLLPFMALSDGAHAATEDFSYFTLLRPATDAAPATSLFGISCTRQMDASQLLVRPADVTRSTVQKAVVIIADSPQFFGLLRERLSVVTKAWFAQREFTDTEILRRFQDSLADEKARGMLNEEEDRDQYLGMSLRELVHEFKWQTLVLLKCCLLQPKMLFFGSRCERLCMMQFSLVSLIPGLLRNLQDSAGPELDSYEKNLKRPTSLRTSDRNSLLAYMGLPLQIFGKGSLFGPYTPLQQLDVLADFGTKSYIVGSTNSLLLQQRDRYSDILINLDEDTINITSTSLKTALQLSVPDRRWIDLITQYVNDTWDESNPGRPKTMGYVGSEEFIRLQFEEYLLTLISSAKYHSHLARYANNPKMLLPHIEGDPAHDFGADFVEAWSKTENYRIMDRHTDSHLFDIVEPRHPCAGGLTIDDVQRRIAQQVQDLHLDERFAQGKEALGRNLAAGKEKASTLFNKLYADMEALRETQRKRNEEAKLQQEKEKQQNEKNEATEAAKAQTTQANRASGFVNSWAAWAGEKRKGWGRSSGDKDASQTNNEKGGGGWVTGWGRGSKTKSPKDEEKEPALGGVRSPRMSTSSSIMSGRTGDSDKRGEFQPLSSRRPLSGESILDAAGSESGVDSPLVSPTGHRPLSGGSSILETTPVIETVLEAAAPATIQEEKGGLERNGADLPTAAVAQPTNNKAIEETTGAVERDGVAELHKDEKNKDDDEQGNTEPQEPRSNSPSPVQSPVPLAALAEAEQAQSAWGR